MGLVIMNVRINDSVKNSSISKEVTLYGDPLKPYKNKTSAYIDSDEDRILWKPFNLLFIENLLFYKFMSISC